MHHLTLRQVWKFYGAEIALNQILPGPEKVILGVTWQVQHDPA